MEEWNQTLDSILAPPAEAPEVRQQADLAQAAPAPGQGSWDDALDSVLDPQWQHKQLAAARERFQGYDEPAMATVAKRAFPFLSPIASALADRDYKAARERFDSGNPSYADIQQIAHRERVGQIESERGTAGKIGEALAGIPAIAGEAAATGGVSLPARLGLTGAAKFVGEKALQAQLMPSMTLKGASERSVQQGGGILSPQNLAPAAALSSLQNIVLGSLPNVAGGIANPAARFAARVGIGMGEQQGVDVLAGAVDQVLPEAYQTKTRFGLIGHALRGEWGEAAQGAVVQAVTFAAFTALHGNPAEGKAALKDFTDTLDEQARRGASRDAATAEARKTLVTIGGSEPVQRGRNLSDHEARALDKFGEGNVFRVSLVGPDNSEVGYGLLAEEGDSIHVPWMGAKGLASGEGRYNPPFGRREVLGLARELAFSMPEMKYVKYSPGEGRIRAGEYRIIDLAKIREAAGKTSEAPPESAQTVPAAPGSPEPRPAPEVAQEPPGSPGRTASGPPAALPESLRSQVEGASQPELFGMAKSLGVAGVRRDMTAAQLRGKIAESFQPKPELVQRPEAAQETFAPRKEDLRGASERPEPGPSAGHQMSVPRTSNVREATPQTLAERAAARGRQAAAEAQVRPNVQPRPGRPAEPEAAPQAELTRREQAVLDARKEGRSLRDIAGQMGVSYETVRLVEKAAQGKLGADKSVHQELQDQQADRILDRLEEGEEVHGHFDANTGQWVEEKVSARERVEPQELSGRYDPETGELLAKAAGRKLDSIDQTQRALDKLKVAYLKERSRAGGRLSTERESEWTARLLGAAREAERAFAGAPAEAPGDRGPTAQPGPGQPPPVRPEGGGGLPGRGPDAGPSPAVQETAGQGPAAESAPGGGEAPGHELAQRRADREAMAGLAKPKGPQLSPRQRLYERQAKDAGIDPAELHYEARRLIDVSRETTAPAVEMYEAADAALKEFGSSMASVLQRMRRGNTDAASAPGLDDVADQMAAQFPEFFDPHRGNPSDTLAAIAERGKPKPMTEVEAYESALDTLATRKIDHARSEALRSGFSARAVEEALRGGEAAGAAEEAAGDAAEHGAADAGDFEFGANAQRPRAMGAAALGELTPPGRSAEPAKKTALANAQIDRERYAEGLSPIINSARLENPEAWDAAMRRVDADPDAGKKLVEALVNKPRPVDVVEGALLLREKIRLDNEYRVLGRQLRDANADLTDLAGLEGRLDELGRDRYDLALAVRRTGTELGRSLQFRKQLAASDYSLQGMLQEFRVAAGREATAEESQKIADLQAKIEELQGKLGAAEGQGGGAEGFEASRPTRVALADAQGEFQRMLKGERTRRGGFGRKLADWLIKLRVNEVISSPVTLAKIVAASAERVAIGPLEEAAGALWSKLPGVAKIAAMAPREGRGLSPVAEKRAVASSFTQGLADAWRTLTTGRSELDVLHGKADVPREWLDLQFSLHDAMKAPAVRAEYTRSFLKRLDAEAAAKRDVTSPAALLRISTEAYKDGQAAKFRQDNWLVDAYNRAVDQMRRPEASVASQVTGTAARLLTPVVRIPTNLAFETGTYIFGTATGSAQAVRAWARGLENLKPAEADAIMRQFKKGSLGAAALLAGYFNPQMFGGFYSGKRDEKDVKPGAARLGGVEVPAWLQHNPLLQVFQFGATIKRAADKVVKGKKQGPVEGVLAGVAGLAEEVPLVRETEQIAGLTSHNARERGHFLGELMKSFAVPQVVQWLAGRMDQNAQGEVKKRKPEGVLQTVETGIPGLRQRVPLNTR